MAETAPPPLAAALRRELDFVKSLLKSGRSIDEMMAAAKAAVRMAARCVEETRRSATRGGTELTIRGLPTSPDWDWRAFKRWLQSRGVSGKAIKFTEKDPALGVGLVRFANEMECSSAADLLASVEPPVRGTSITVERGMAAEYVSKSRKRGREGDEEAGEGEAGGRAPKAPRVPDVCEAVCPWWRVPYGQQLTDKHQRIAAALGQITAEVDRRTYGAKKPDWVRAARGRADAAAASSGAAGAAGAAPGAAGGGRGGDASGPPCCPLLGILRSPAIERYRNKSEFTAGLDEREQPAVGFLRGAFQDGITCVGAPDAARHTSLAAVRLAAAAAEYIRTGSAFPVYDKRKHEGFWRLVLVREGSSRTFMPSPQTTAAEAAQPAVLDNPTFATLDPFTYLVTFGSAATAAAEEPDAAAAATPAAAKAEDAAEAKPDGAAAAEKSGDDAAAAAEAGQAGMEVDGGAQQVAADAASGGGGGGVHVSAVSEAEPERPLPDEVLVMLQVNPNYAGAVADRAAAARELRAMTAALHAAAAAAGLPLTTVRVQYHHGVSNAAPYDAPVKEVPAAAAAEAAEADGVAAAVAAASGPGYIHDSLLDLKFRISPTAFFQVNSPATCVLYKLVGDWAAARPNSLLLDICCGTGTIGLTLASKVSKVVGVDSVASAIDDARVNASLNGITNAEFVAGKAEDALPGILARHASSSAYGCGDVVAVADPPRAGLHKAVLRALLGCDKIRRLVFVSCNPDNLVQNVATLCSPPSNRSGRDRGGRYGGRGGRGRDDDDGGNYTPFRPVKAVALDLFPHTAHVEAVMLLER